MISKIIHYIWLGGNPLPKIAEKCIESWKKFCPDYEVMRWDESNLDINKYNFTKQAYQEKKYAFVSDVFRTEILYQHGGIYFDIDVELIKPIDEFLTHDCFMGFETSNLVNPGLIIGSVTNNQDLFQILQIYKKLEFDINFMKKITVCEIFTSYYEKQGLKRLNKTQAIGNTCFYASEFFSPIDVVTNKKKITNNTYSIHWYTASWYTPKQKFKNKVKKLLNFCSFGLFGKLIRKN